MQQQHIALNWKVERMEKDKQLIIDAVWEFPCLYNYKSPLKPSSQYDAGASVASVALWASGA